MRNRITAGQVAPGDVLPSEAELCREFESSRGPVRQALGTLRAEGVIVGGRGKPPRVRGGVHSQPFTTFLSFSEWARSIGRTPGQRTIETARRGASAAAAAQLGIVEGDPAIHVLRVRLLDGEPAMLERTTFTLDVGRLLFDFDPDSGSIFDFLRGQGVDLNVARHTIDACAASDTDAELLGCPVGSPLLRERRVTSSSDGTPFEYSDDRYLPGVTNFTIENTAERRAALVRVVSSA